MCLNSCQATKMLPYKLYNAEIKEAGKSGEVSPLEDLGAY